MTIRVPPLRERRDDIPLLVQHFVARYSAEYKKAIRGVQPSAMERTLLVEPDMLREREHRYILRTLQQAQGNLTEAAQALGISVRSLHDKLKACGHESKEPPRAENLHIDTATSRDWEPLRTNFSLVIRAHAAGSCSSVR